jgi:hypothetical protein
MKEERSHDKRVTPIVWMRKGGVQRGFDIGMNGVRR